MKKNIKVILAFELPEDNFLNEEYQVFISAIRKIMPNIIHTVARRQEHSI